MTDPVFGTMVTEDEAWGWMDANGYSGPGDILNECATYTTTLCGTFTRDGNDFTAKGENGAKATLTIERFDSTVILNRYEKEGASAGLSARYEASARQQNRGNGHLDQVQSELEGKLDGGGRSVNQSVAITLLQGI